MRHVSGWLPEIRKTFNVPTSVSDQTVVQGMELTAQQLLWLHDPYLFLTKCCFTFDETAPEDRRVQPIPKKRYLQAFTDYWRTERLFCLVKSRRMIISWACTGLEIHTGMTSPGWSGYILSDTQTKSEKFLGRGKWLLEHLPSDFPKVPWEVRMGGMGDPKVIRFPLTGSKIEALSSDPNSIRQEGASYIRCEEFHVWQWPEESWKAIMPTILGGGRIVVVATPAAGTAFERLVFDRLGQTAGSLPRALG